MDQMRRLDEKANRQIQNQDELLRRQSELIEHNARVAEEEKQNKIKQVMAEEESKENAEKQHRIYAAFFSQIKDTSADIPNQKCVTMKRLNANSVAIDGKGNSM